MKKLAVLISGRGSNLQSIIDAINTGELSNTEISIVISNKNDVYGLERAKKTGIKNVFLNPKDFSTKEDYDKKLVEIIRSNNVDLIILAGYMKILTEGFVKEFPNKIINIHPALLPKHGGKGMYGEKVHKTVLESGDKESGCTAHFVTTEVDAGPIIAQTKVSVLPDDTVDTLAQRVLKEEHKLLVEAIKKVLLVNSKC